MTNGGSAEAYLEAVVHLDAVTGLVVGQPQITDMNRAMQPAPCGMPPPPK